MTPVNQDAKLGKTSSNVLRVSTHIYGVSKETRWDEHSFLE